MNQVPSYQIDETEEIKELDSSHISSLLNRQSNNNEKLKKSKLQDYNNSTILLKQSTQTRFEDFNSPLILTAQNRIYINSDMQLSQLDKKPKSEDQKDHVIIGNSSDQIINSNSVSEPTSGSGINENNSSKKNDSDNQQIPNGLDQSRQSQVNSKLNALINTSEIRSQPKNPSQKSYNKYENLDFVSIFKQYDLISPNMDGKNQNEIINFTSYKPFNFQEYTILQGKPLSDRSNNFSTQSHKFQLKDVIIDDFKFKLSDLLNQSNRSNSDDLLKVKKAMQQTPMKNLSGLGYIRRKVSEKSEFFVSNKSNSNSRRRKFSKLEALTPTKIAHKKILLDNERIVSRQSQTQTGGFGIAQHPIQQEIDNLKSDEDSQRISRVLIKNDLRLSNESSKNIDEYNLRFSEVMNDVFKDSKRSNQTFDSLTETGNSYDFEDDGDTQDFKNNSPRILTSLELDKYEEQFHNKIIIQKSKIASFMSDNFTSKIKKAVWAKGDSLNISKQNSMKGSTATATSTSLMSPSKVQLNLFEIEKSQNAIMSMTDNLDEQEIHFITKQKKYFVKALQDIDLPHITNALVQGPDGKERRANFQNKKNQSASRSKHEFHKAGSNLSGSNVNLIQKKNTQFSSQNSAIVKTLSLTDQTLLQLKEVQKSQFPDEVLLIDVFRNNKFKDIIKPDVQSVRDVNYFRIEILDQQFLEFIQINIFNQDLKLYGGLFHNHVIKQENLIVTSKSFNKRQVVEVGRIYPQLVLRFNLQRQSQLDESSNISSSPKRDQSPVKIQSFRNDVSSRLRLKSHVFLTNTLTFIYFNQDQTQNDELALFDEKKYKKSAVSSFKLNEVFGYTIKTLSLNLFEVFEPKPDARSIIFKGIKRKQQIDKKHKDDIQVQKHKRTGREDFGSGTSNKMISNRGGGSHSRNHSKSKRTIQNQNTQQQQSLFQAISQSQQNHIHISYENQKGKQISQNPSRTSSNMQLVNRWDSSNGNVMSTMITSSIQDNHQFKETRRSSFNTTKMKTMLYPPSITSYSSSPAHSGEKVIQITNFDNTGSKLPLPQIEKLNTISGGELINKFRLNHNANNQREISVGLLGPQNSGNLGGYSHLLANSSSNNSNSNSRNNSSRRQNQDGSSIHKNKNNNDTIGLFNSNETLRIKRSTKKL
eukprot:403367727